MAKFKEILLKKMILRKSSKNRPPIKNREILRRSGVGKWDQILTKRGTPYSKVRLRGSIRGEIPGQGRKIHIQT